MVSADQMRGVPKKRKRGKNFHFGAFLGSKKALGRDARFCLSFLAFCGCYLSSNLKLIECNRLDAFAAKKVESSLVVDKEEQSYTLSSF